MGDTCHMCVYVCMYAYTYSRYHPYMHRYDKYCITMASIITIILTSNNNNISCLPLRKSTGVVENFVFMFNY